MAYPPTFTPFPWQDLPVELTPFDTEKAHESERSLAAFVEQYQSVHWRAPVGSISERETVYKKGGGNVAEGDVVAVYEVEELFILNSLEEWKPLQIAHWKSPVKEESKLPTTKNTLYDIRMVEEPGILFYCVKVTGTVKEQWKRVITEPEPPVELGKIKTSIEQTNIQNAAVQITIFFKVKAEAIIGKAKVTVEGKTLPELKYLGSTVGVGTYAFSFNLKEKGTWKVEYSEGITEEPIAWFQKF